MRAPNTNTYKSVPDTYWRLIFGLGNGIQHAIITCYNSANSCANFMTQVQATLDPYGLLVKNVTLKVPPSTLNKKPSEIVITSQREFLRALSLIPNNSDMFNPLCGIEAYVNKDDALKSPGDSGYSSEIGSP
jgi:hypothetical protein